MQQVPSPLHRVLQEDPLCAPACEGPYLVLPYVSESRCAEIYIKGKRAAKCGKA